MKWPFTVTMLGDRLLKCRRPVFLSPGQCLTVDAVGQLVVLPRHVEQLLAKRSDRLLIAQPAEPGSLISVMRRSRCGSLRFHLTYVNRNAVLVNACKQVGPGCLSVRPDRLPWGSRGKTG